MIRVILSESETFLFYEQEHTSVRINSEEADRETKRWNLYCQKKSDQLHKVREVPCQTKIYVSVDKPSQRTAVQLMDDSVSCSPKEMYSDTHTPKSEVKDILTNILQLKSERKKEFYSGDLKDKIQEHAIDCYFLLQGLRQVDRALNFNRDRYLLRLYARPTNYPPIKERQGDEPAPTLRIQTLIPFSSAKVSDRQRINCFTFCPGSKWMILLGSGELSFDRRKGGHVTCWNIKNSNQPEFCIPTSMPVTALSSNPSFPHLCGVALIDGTVRVYRLSASGLQLIFDSRIFPDFGCHAGPVWSLGWRFPKHVHAKPMRVIGEKPSFRYILFNPKNSKSSGAQMAFPIVSLSEDGTIREWLFSVESGLLTSSVIVTINFTDICKWQNLILDSSTTRDPKRCLNMCPIKSPALSFVFKPGSEHELLIGMQSGDLFLWHTYSRFTPSEVFEGHTNAVTSLSWYDFSPEGNSISNPTIFLSSSLDGHLKIWEQGKYAPRLTLKSPFTEDIQGYIEANWCPWLMFLIIGVHPDGIHFWDISYSTTVPVSCFRHRGITNAKFNPHSRTILVSENTGQLIIYRITGFGDTGASFMKLTTAVKKLVKLDPFRS